MSCHVPAERASRAVGCARGLRKSRTNGCRPEGDSQRKRTQGLIQRMVSLARGAHRVSGEQWDVLSLAAAAHKGGRAS